MDNIPFTAAMIPVVEQLLGESGDDAYWWALALGACFGGNATIVAAACNVAAAGMAARAGRPIGFMVFLRSASSVTFVHAARPPSTCGALRMSPRSLSEPLAPPTDARSTRTIARSPRSGSLLDSGVPALPVINRDERFAGIFGEREFIRALFPGYLNQLKCAGFVRRSLDQTLEKRAACRDERVGQHMNTEHVDVGTDHSDTQIAEIFLHHRVLLVPVLDDRHVVGVITRTDFFRTIAERFLERQ